MAKEFSIQGLKLYRHALIILLLFLLVQRFCLLGPWFLGRHRVPGLSVYVDARTSYRTDPSCHCHMQYHCG